MDDGRLDALGQTIVSALPGAALGHSVAFNQLTVDIEPTRIVEVAKYLRDGKIKLQEPKDLFNFYLKGGGAKLNEELGKMLKQ